MHALSVLKISLATCAHVKRLGMEIGSYIKKENKYTYIYNNVYIVILYIDKLFLILFYG